MMYSELKFYLESNLARPSLTFKWTRAENNHIINYINENFPKDYLKERKNILTIKQAFKDYFEKVGFLLFTFKENTIRIKVLPYNIEPQNSVNLDPVIGIINDNDDLIEYDYKGMENQILITDELVNKITTFLKSEKDENVNKKELIKYAIKCAFELEDKDIIVNKKGHIFVKVVHSVKRNSAESRFNGIDEEELEDFHVEFFSNGDNKNFFPLVARIFTDTYFHEKKINNFTYEQYAFPYIQKIIEQELNNISPGDHEFYKGFSGYVFRIHFREVFEHIADLVLAEIAITNPYMTEFLKYYSLNIIVINGDKYRVPTLDAGNGLKWNVLSMLSISKVYTKTTQTIKKLKREIDRLENEIDKLYINGLSPTKYQTAIIKKQNDITKEINKEMKKLEKHYDSIKKTKNEKEKEWINTQIKDIKLDVADLREDKNFLADKMLPQERIKLYLDLSKELDADSLRLKREESLFKQNEETYISIKNAIVNAFTSKKQRI